MDLLACPRQCVNHVGYCLCSGLSCYVCDAYSRLVTTTAICTIMTMHEFTGHLGCPRRRIMNAGIYLCSGPSCWVCMRCLLTVNKNRNRTTRLTLYLLAHWVNMLYVQYLLMGRTKHPRIDKSVHMHSVLPDVTL